MNSMAQQPARSPVALIALSGLVLSLLVVLGALYLDMPRSASAASPRATDDSTTYQSDSSQPPVIDAHLESKDSPAQDSGI